jgi:hypothetical protein
LGSPGSQSPPQQTSPQQGQQQRLLSAAGQPPVLDFGGRGGIDSGSSAGAAAQAEVHAPEQQRRSGNSTAAAKRHWMLCQLTHAVLTTRAAPTAVQLWPHCCHCNLNSCNSHLVGSQEMEAGAWARPRRGSSHILVGCKRGRAWPTAAGFAALAPWSHRYMRRSTRGRL